MKIITMDHWNDELWKKASLVYHQAFGKSGAKPEKIIRNMFKKQICYLHVVMDKDNVTAMAITGKLVNSRALIIDYLAVREDLRSHGLGEKLLEYIKKWCVEKLHLEGIVIEVESEPSEENLKRISFWQKNNFELTEYIHHYIWVPETYQAMLVKLVSNSNLPLKGEELFQYIVQFHKESFSIV